MDKQDKIDKLIDDNVLNVLQSVPDENNLKIFYAKLKQAQLGMMYKRDREIMKRVSNGQMIRVVALISDSKEQQKEYIKMTMPEIKLIE